MAKGMKGTRADVILVDDIDAPALPATMTQTQHAKEELQHEYPLMINSLRALHRELLDDVSVPFVASLISVRVAKVAGLLRYLRNSVVPDWVIKREALIYLLDKRQDMSGSTSAKTGKEYLETIIVALDPYAK